MAGPGKSGVAPRPAIDRIMPRIEYEANTGCWLWPGAHMQSGHGVILDGDHLTGVHRVTYRAFKGDPGDLFVCHKCDTPACCNPDHLFLGTQAENLADMRRKGRAVRKGAPGERNANALVTAAQVRAIRALAATSALTQGQIGAAFGIGQTGVSDIVRRKSWSHI